MAALNKKKGFDSIQRSQIPLRNFIPILVVTVRTPSTVHAAKFRLLRPLALFDG